MAYQGGGAKRSGGRMRRRRRKICIFCADHIDANQIDYKDVSRLRKYISDRGKILPRRVSGNCAKHQRAVCAAVKKGRSIGLLPIVVD